MKKLLFILMFLGCTSLFAQESSEADKLKDEVAKINKILLNLPKFSGYVQTGYVFNDKNSGDKSTFQMKRMRLFIKKEVSKTFEFKTQLEFFSGSRDGNVGKKVMTIMDAFVNVRLEKAINFRVGQFYKPIGFENYDISPASLETIDFSNVIYRLVCRNAVTTPNLIDYGRDIGVMAYGDLFDNKEKNFSHLSYQIALVNGQLPTLTDNNKSKDFISRITFRPIKKLRILGSYNWGEYENETSLYNSMNRFTVGAWYSDPKGINVRAEYGHIESDKANVDEDGSYILASYNIGKFIPVIRYDRYRDNINETTANNRDLYTLGFAYKLSNKFKLQLNYLRYAYADKVIDAGVREDDGNGFRVMGILKF